MADEETLKRTQQRFTDTMGPLSPLELEKARIEVVEATSKLQDDGHSMAPPKDFAPSSVDFRDLKTTGRIASQFNQGLDKITDVLLILILKFGRASSMLVGVLVGIAVAIIVMVFNTVYLATTNSDLAILLDEMHKVQGKQTDILKKAEEAHDRAVSAEKEARAAKEAAPEIVVNEAGQTSLVVKGDSSLPSKANSSNIKSPNRSSAKRTPKGVEIPLDF